MFPEFVDKSFKNTWLECSVEEYRALPAANFSSINKILRSPAFYKYNLENPGNPTPSMKYGTLAHMAMLEGEKFLNSYVVEPEFWGVTKDGKPTNSKNAKDVQEKYSAWKSQLGPQTTIVTQDELDSLNGIISSLLGNKAILKAIQNGFPEARGVFRDNATGLKCKFAADLWMPEHGYLLDFKTTGKSTEWDVFRKSVETLNYDMQLAMYADGIEAITGQYPKIIGWVVADTNAPYEIEVHLAHDLYLAAGRMKYKTALKKIAACLKSGQWPQRQQERDFEMPEPSVWYMKQYEGVYHE